MCVRWSLNRAPLLIGGAPSNKINIYKFTCDASTCVWISKQINVICFYSIIANRLYLLAHIKWTVRFFFGNYKAIPIMCVMGIPHTGNPFPSIINSINFFPITNQFIRFLYFDELSAGKVWLSSFKCIKFVCGNCNSEIFASNRKYENGNKTRSKKS